MMDRTAILISNSGGILEMRSTYPVPPRITLDSDTMERLTSEPDLQQLAWKKRRAVQAREADFVFWQYMRIVGVNDTAAVYLEV